MKKLAQRALRLLACFGAVALVTFVAYRLIPVNATTAGFGYLLLVLIIASTWGFFEAAFSSVLLTLGFNFFFLPPIGTFTIADPQNWIALFTFLATSLIASRLSTKAKLRALDAIESQRQVERLYSFSRAILLTGPDESFQKQLVLKLAETFELAAAVLYDRRTGEFYRAGPLDFEGLDDQVRDSALHGTSFSDGQANRTITAVRLGSEAIASLALQGGHMPDSVLQGIANLTAIGLERARAQALAHEIEAARQSEQLRTTLIDAMAHEFKTPLTVIKGATSSLLTGHDDLSGSSREQLTIADEEADHLTQLLDDAIEIARLDTEHIQIHPALSDLGTIVHEVVASMKIDMEDRPLEIKVDEGIPLVPVDRRLLKLAMKQLVDNAIKYSPADAPVLIRVGRSDAGVFVEVTDRGQGIQIEEQMRIFERFYRGHSVKTQIPGSGLGLSIAHRIMQAHQGDLSVTSRPGETTFRMTLPLEQAEGRNN